MKTKLLIAIILAHAIAHSQCSDWTRKGNFAGTGRESAVGFSIGLKGYIGTGKDSTGVRNDFWEWDPSTNAWTQKANFGGQARWYANGFSIGAKGYIGIGYDPTFKGDFWEYNPTTNAWTQKADFAGTPRARAVGFSINNKGYIGTGVDASGVIKDFWQYDPSGNTWTRKADFGGISRDYAVGFSIGTKGYIGTGSGGTNDFWEYDPINDSWIQRANFGGAGRSNAIGFSIGSNGYIGTGLGGTYWKDFWEYGSPASMPYEICISTVDSVTSSKNILVWTKPISASIDSFRIYRQISSTFKRLASVPYNSLSLFTDSLNVNPKSGSYKYRISAFTTGGIESVLSNTNETMYLQVTNPTWPAYNLTWNDYCGFPVSKYYIYRDANHTNSWTKIDSVGWGTNVFIDSFPPTDSSIYRIEAVPIQPCFVTIKNQEPQSTSVKSSKSNSSDRLATGINDHTIEPFSVLIYPNPNFGEFSIYSANFSVKNPCEIKIYSILGELVHEEKIHDIKVKISLEKIPKGIYQLEIKSRQGRINRKIVVQ